MRRRMLAAIIVTALLSGQAARISGAQAAETGGPVTGRFLSPDGRLVAVISAGGGKRQGGAEVQIVTAAGRPLLRSDYASGGSDRLDVLQAKWTPDSAFFVFSATSADGHQPWRFPVLFYSRATNEIRRLEDFTGGVSVVDSGFKVFAPDIVEVVGQKTIDQPSHARRFRLGALPVEGAKARRRRP